MARKHQDVPLHGKQPDPRTTSFTEYIAKSIQRGTFWSSTARWLRDHGYPFPMSWPAYAFDRYMRSRNELQPPQWFFEVAFEEVPGLVSIVLPVYNGEKFLSEAIESIQSQTYPHWELIVVDDGSTDRTAEILSGYAAQDQRITVVHQENKRLPNALNTGFALAKGEFLTWTSCDNRLKARCLEVLVNSLGGQPACDMVYGNIDIVDETGAPLRNSLEFVTYQRPFGSEHIYLPQNPVELNVVPNNIIGPAFLYRNRARQLIGDYHSRWFTVEDYDYWMRLNALLALRHTPDPSPIYEYRFHSDSLTGRKTELKIYDHRQKLLIFDDFRRSYYLSPSVWIVETCSDTPSAAIDDLKCKVEEVGHIFLTGEQAARYDLPHSHLPILLARVTRQTECLSGINQKIPGSALRVMLVPKEDTHSNNPRWSWEVHLENQSGEFKAWCTAPDTARLIAVLDTKAKSHGAEILAKESNEPPDTPLRVSVIVCSHRLVESLAACLRSLAAQDFPAGHFEVIAVNNNIRLADLDDCVLAARASLFAGSEERLRLVHCPVPGLSHARNAGLAEARGEVVLFIDDDARAAPDWVTSIVRAFDEHPESGVVGGKILLTDPQPRPWWYRASWKRFWSHFDPPYRTFTTAQNWSQYPWGANWGARRTALLEIGGFISKYGRKSGSLTGGEEIIAASQIQKLGWKIGVEPSAVVIHQVDPARFTLGYVWRSIRSSRKTWYQVQKDQYIEMETGLGDMLGRIWQSFKALRSDSVLKPLFTIGSEAALVLWLLKDLVLRFRKPVTGR